ncbi:MAG TPA: repressor LexA, partial [Myxococcales bacterium]|nr:repressor LexA [Myxococcales bacterium]
QETEGFVSVQTDAEDLFALRVRGLSMSDAAIVPGDLLVVRRQPDADDGDIVVAIVDDEATVKRLRKRNNQVELHPENSDFDVMVPEHMQLLGKVIEVRRQLERAGFVTSQDRI